MLPSNRRVSKKLFSHVMKAGKSLHSNHFLVKISPQDILPRPSGTPLIIRGAGGDIGDMPTRIAISVSKKVASTAVARNSIKRIISAYIESVIKKIPNNYIILVMPKAGITRENIKEAIPELENILNRVFAI